MKRAMASLVVAVVCLSVFAPGAFAQEQDEKLLNEVREAQARQKQEDEKRLAEAPEQLKPLVKEIIIRRAEARHIRIGLAAKKMGEDERVLLQAKADGLDVRADALEEIAEMRRQTAERLKDVGDVKGQPQVLPFAEEAAKAVERYEQSIRARAEMSASAREADARAQLFAMEANERAQAAWQRYERLVQTAERVKEAQRRVEELADPEALAGFVEQVNGRIQEFMETYGEKKQLAAAMAETAKSALEEALKHVQSAQASHMKAGEYVETRKELVRAIEGWMVAEELCDRLARRIELEKRVAALAARAKSPAIQECLERFRKAGDEVALQSVLAAKAAADPQASGNLSEVVLKRAESVAAMDQAGEQLERLLNDAGGH